MKCGELIIVKIFNNCPQKLTTCNNLQKFREISYHFAIIYSKNNPDLPICTSNAKIITIQLIFAPFSGLNNNIYLILKTYSIQVL